MTDTEIAPKISLAGRALSVRIERGLEPYGIGRGEYRVLFALYNEEGISQTTIVERHHLNKGVIARVVRRLEEKGYVECHPDPDDKRRKLLYLTDDAEAIRSEIEDLKTTIDAELVEGLSDDEIATLAKGLQVATENLGVDIEAEIEDHQ
ncbi:MarR family transcriptional regulator [Haladaptatus sp. DYF46]|uniref:MarR family winged helix-turn-helix transcriptional regulator n=1 Tax=Haladaptatus sp. DYF46 TaxID=2886041 RepID=UPI001E5E8F35|nr:MarR family transcriptional regulator [Haladaptatus sp. DYF46]